LNETRNVLRAADLIQDLLELYQHASDLIQDLRAFTNQHYVLFRIDRVP
jgi:hypothetical protein